MRLVISAGGLSGAQRRSRSGRRCRDRAQCAGILKVDLEDIEAEVEAASEAVNVAVAAALTPVVREMLEEAKHFRAEFLARKYALDVMRARWGR